MSRIYIGARRDVTLVLQTAFLRPCARARLRIGARCIPNDTRSRKKAGHRRRLHCDRVTRVYILRVHADRMSATTAPAITDEKKKILQERICQIPHLRTATAKIHSLQNATKVYSFAIHRVCLLCRVKSVSIISQILFWYFHLFIILKIIYN